MSDDPSDPALDDYEPPQVSDLGTLAEMTLGAIGGGSDAMGGASGSGGSI